MGAEGSPLAVAARAWCRVDLAGGTLDIWPLGLLHPGASTVNLAVDLAVDVRLRRSGGGYVVQQGGSRIEAGSVAELRGRPETALVAVVAEALDLPPVDVELASASPRGGGLGASSALAVALIAAAEELLERPPSDASERARLAQDLEARLLGIPTGTQDHYPALLGGALHIRYLPGGERVRRLEVDLEALGGSLLVVYTGQSHFSAGNNWQVVRRRLEDDPEVTELLGSIAAVTAELAGALEEGDLPAVGGLMGREWSYRRQMAEGISTPLIEDLLARSRKLGAWGGKACGAGGGGCVAILCPPERRGIIASELTQSAGQVLDTRPTAEPLRVDVPGS